MKKSTLIPLYMPHPERFWLASRQDFEGLCDPDVEDGRLRHPDRFDVDWRSVARAAAANGQRLVKGDTYTDDDGDQMFNLDLTGLGTTEKDIVLSWFPSMIDAPRGDPGDEKPKNGRHRLWNCWAEYESLLLPVHSDFLPYEEEIPHMPKMREAMKLDALRVAGGCSEAVAVRAPMYWQAVKSWL